MQLIIHFAGQIGKRLPSEKLLQALEHYSHQRNRSQATVLIHYLSHTSLPFLFSYHRS